jgi:hypothetical protein
MGDIKYCPDDILKKNLVAVLLGYRLPFRLLLPFYMRQKKFPKYEINSSIINVDYIS